MGNQVKYDKCGRITCPLALASILRLEKGVDEMTWHVENGQIIVRKVTKIYNGQFDFETDEIKERLIKFEEETTGTISDRNLSEEEKRAKAYESYIEDQKKKLR